VCRLNEAVSTLTQREKSLRKELSTIQSDHKAYDDRRKDDLVLLRERLHDMSEAYYSLAWYQFADPKAVGHNLDSIRNSIRL
jgi:flagellar capping protein FliD